MGVWELERAEYRIFCLAVTDAVRLAMAGKIEAGHRCLRTGLENARELAESGDEWAKGLVEDYDLALRHFNDLVEQQRQAVYRYTLLQATAGQAQPAGRGRSRRDPLMQGARPFRLRRGYRLSPN